MRPLLRLRFAAFLALAACGGGGTDTPDPVGPPAVTAVSVAPATLNLQGIGATGALAATIAPSTAMASVTWSTNNAAVATVTGSGPSATVTAVSAGTATITATSGGRSGSATVTVTSTVRTLTLATSAFTLVPAQPQPLALTARDEGGAVITNPAVTYTTSAESVATVSSAGVITAVAPGTATITASAASANVTASVTVLEGGYVTASGGTITALGGQLQLVVPTGAVSAPTALTVRTVSTPPTNARLLANTAVLIEPAVTFASPATLRLRYTVPLAADVVETQLRLARLDGSTWQEQAVRVVDRTNRRVTALASTTGTWAVFVPPPSLRSFAQLAGREVGTAVSADALRSDATYRQLLAAEFNSVTPENVMKFGPIHPAPTTYNFADADSLLSFAAAHNMTVHGHVLLWHNQQPAWLTVGTPTRASLLAALRDHIQTVVTRYAGRIATWDVANEVIADNGTGLRASFWTTIAGPDIIDSAFAWARRADPNAKLYLNDYAVEAIGPKSDSMFALAMRLRAAGVPIDGIGLQAHFLVNPPSLAQQSANVARFVAAGFDVRYTELDVRLANGTDGLAAQATAYGNAVRACRTQLRCRAVTVWGFTDRYSWIPGAFPGFGRGHLWDDVFAPKPAYTGFRDAWAVP
jgi:endo-1,4-beta-xylanase